MSGNRDDELLALEDLNARGLGRHVYSPHASSTGPKLGFGPRYRLCPICKGKQVVNGESCFKCLGHGRVHNQIIATDMPAWTYQRQLHEAAMLLLLVAEEARSFQFDGMSFDHPDADRLPGLIEMGFDTSSIFDGEDAIDDMVELFSIVLATLRAKQSRHWEHILKQHTGSAPEAPQQPTSAATPPQVPQAHTEAMSPGLKPLVDRTVPALRYHTELTRVAGVLINAAENAIDLRPGQDELATRDGYVCTIDEAVVTGFMEASWSGPDKVPMMAAVMDACSTALRDWHARWGRDKGASDGT